MKVSLYKENYQSPRTVQLAALMEAMRSEKHAKALTAFRQALKHYSPDSPCPEEKKPPTVLFASTFQKGEGKARWTGYSGIVLLELQHGMTAAESARLRRRAAQCPQTLAVFKGSSGKSLKILVLFRRPDGDLPVTEETTERFHAHACRQASHFYGMLLSQKLTRQKESLHQGCRLSYDPELYYNPQAVPILLEQPLDMPNEDTPTDSSLRKPELTRLEQLVPGWEREEETAFLFNMTLQETLRQWEEGKPEEEPEGFLIQLAKNCFQTGIPEEEAVKRTRWYSPLGEKEARIRTVIRNVYRQDKGFGAHPVHSAVQLLAFRLDEFMKRRYELRRNVLKKEVEYRERASLISRFYPVTEEALNTFSLQAHEEALDFWDRDIKRYVYSNRIPFYHPISDYLDQLPPWDGTDHIRKLAATLPTDNPHWSLCFYRWFLGMVAQWKGMNRMHGNCIVPVLSGPQSAGKSSWCKQILPPPLREYYTESLDMTARRNAELALHRFALINLDEFDAIPTGKHPLLKHLLQLPEVSIRRPHRSHTEVLPRHASFIATCNPVDILTDPTGSRRFLCVEVTDKIAPQLTINHPQLFAQAVSALRRDERYWFDTEEEAAVTHSNAAFSRMSTEEQLLLQLFRPAEEASQTGQWLSAMEILLHIQERGKIKSSQTSMTFFGRILRKHRFQRKHSVQGNLYWVELNP